MNVKPLLPEPLVNYTYISTTRHRSSADGSVFDDGRRYIFLSLSLFSTVHTFSTMV